MKTLITLNDNVSIFGMRFSPSFKTGLRQRLMIESEVVECINCFIHQGSPIGPDDLESGEISAGIKKARLASDNLRHSWHRLDIRLQNKRKVYWTAVLSILLYGRETHPLRIKDNRKSLVFDHKCL